MSARCSIIIKVKPEDIGKVKKFDEVALGMRPKKWDSPYYDKGFKLVEPVTITEKYIGIYCHSSGFIEDGVGEVLKERFNRYDEALNLILGGALSVLNVEYYKPYIARDCEDWGTCQPIQATELMALRDKIASRESVFYFDGVWHYGGRYDTIVKEF